MSTTAQAQIVHESEAQRQHVRLPLPAKVMIGGAEYNVRDMSSGGVGVRDIAGDFPAGKLLPVKLELPFGTFSLDMNLTAEVQHYSPQEQLLGCNFVNLTAEQISLINHVLKAFLAGDVVASGDLLNVATRNNFVKPRKQKADGTPAFDIKRQIPGLLTVVVLGVFALYMLLGNAYDSFFVTKASDAYVSAPVTDLRTPAAGIYKSLLEPGSNTVQAGQLLGQISDGATGGVMAQITSPCNCVIVKSTALDGVYAAAGTPVIALVSADAKPTIVAAVAPSEVARLVPNEKARFKITGTRTEFTGRIVDIQSGLSDEAANPQFVYAIKPVLVTVAPDQVLPAELANKPARVTFMGR